MEQLVSIIVPIYMIEEYLPKCIESIQHQSLQNIEIILVDDGSKDRCGEICDRYAVEDERIKVIHKENGGLVSARKAGIKSARGQYIGFVDGDDWVEKETFSTLYGEALEHKADIVINGYLEDINGITHERKNKIAAGVYDKQKIQEEIIPNMLCYGGFYSAGIQPYIWNKLIRKEMAIENVLDIDERIRTGEDVAAIVPMIVQAERVVITEECNYHYCVRKSSMMWSEKKEEEERQRLQILHTYLERKIYTDKVMQMDVGQLYKYSMNNILTRIFGLVNHNCNNSVLWPFENVNRNCSIILYGAGNFGRAVYGYVKKYMPDNLRLWVDREYKSYNILGLPVQQIESIQEYVDTDGDVLIAVLDQHSAYAITDNLEKMGIPDNRIHCLNISDDSMIETLKKQDFI